MYTPFFTASYSTRFPGKKRSCGALLFFGKEMRIALPASTDIYLTGGKSHPSETKLARFLVRDLSTGSVFIDIGAHYGYFSLLAATIIQEGIIHSFEPSEAAFGLLRQNTAGSPRITAWQKAVAGNEGSIGFFEFDNLHSEFNSASIGQFEGEGWFRRDAVL
ncbi:MAG: FkbM family methyltransferase, partial [Chitinophagaceae bacterium]